MRSRIVAVAISTALISGCATQSPQTKPAEGAHSQAEQLKAQSSKLKKKPLQTLTNHQS